MPVIMGKDIFIKAKVLSELENKHGSQVKMYIYYHKNQVRHNSEWVKLVWDLGRRKNKEMYSNSPQDPLAFTSKMPSSRNQCTVNCYINAAAAKSLQSCPTLCHPIDGSPPDSAIPGILQARTLEWVAISFSNTGKWKVKVKSLRHVWLFATPWTAAYQAPPSMGISRQEYWSGVPLPSPP